MQPPLRPGCHARRASASRPDRFTSQESCGNSGTTSSSFRLGTIWTSSETSSPICRAHNIKERTKFQHNFDPATKGLLYRVQLLRTNLSRLPRTRLQDTEYAVETYRKPPGHRREESLGRKLCSADDGEILFLDECKQYLDDLYTEAGLTKRHFELAPFHTQHGPRALPYVDLRYVTILRTRNDEPLVMTHWRVRHDQNGNPLPGDRCVDRLQFWNASDQFVCFEEDKEFRAGIEQVKDISKEIMACAHRIDAGDLTTLARQLMDCGVTLRYERKV